jgi:acetolactate synthase-1/2/3 large subunit
VHTAAQDSTPMILFIGQVQRNVRGREAFQEVEFRHMFAPLAKWVAEVESADRIPEYVLRAFQVATSGRPGPVVLSLPEDVLAEQSGVCNTKPHQPVQASPKDDELAAVRNELQNASTPLLIVGGSSWSDAGCAALAHFAESNALPVLASFRRQDLIDNRHVCYAGHLSLGLPPHLQQRVKAADLVIALGSRLGDVTTMTYSVLKPPRIGARLIHIHPDANELGRVYQSDLPIVAAPSAAAIRLAEIPPVASPFRRRRRARALTWRSSSVIWQRSCPPTRSLPMAPATSRCGSTGSSRTRRRIQSWRPPAARWATDCLPLSRRRSAFQIGSLSVSPATAIF